MRPSGTAASGSRWIGLFLGAGLALGFGLLLLGCRRGDIPILSGDEAYQYLVRQCAFGPRCPGSPGHRAMKEYLQHELESKAETVAVQNFRHPAGNGKDTLDLTNLIARFRPRAKDRILLCAHWDTRPWADQDPVPENRKTPIPGANDGGSGVAILLALAGILHRNPPPCGVDIALFDGEDYGTDEHPENYLLGSTHFAQSLEAPLPRLAIVLDMVGDRDLKLFQERNSLLFAPRETGAIWRVGRRIAPDVFMPEAQYTITDDHLPLLMKGIPAVDVIDFDYPYWHTLQDTPDKCSPRSLAVVGQTVLGMIYR